MTSKNLRRTAGLVAVLFAILSLLYSGGEIQAQAYTWSQSFRYLSDQEVTLLAELDVLKYAQNESRAYFVNDYSGDTQNGGHISDPFKKIQTAVDACATGRGDFIILQPTNSIPYDGDAVSASLTNAYVYINKANLTIVAMNSPAYGEVVVYPGAAASVGIFNLGALADRVRLVNISFNATTAAQECIQATAAANYVVVKRCIFQNGTKGIDAPGTVIGWSITDNTFLDQTLAGVYGYFRLANIKNNTFQCYNTTGSTNGLDSLGAISLLDNTTTADSDGSVISGNTILGGDATVSSGGKNADFGIVVATACVNVGVVNNFVSGCDVNISGTAANGQYFTNNYTATTDTTAGIWAPKAAGILRPTSP